LAKEAEEAYGWHDKFVTSVKEIDKLSLDEVEDYATYLRDIALESDNVADSLENQYEASLKIAKIAKTAGLAISDLVSNFNNYITILDTAEKDSEAYFGAIDALK